MFYSELEFNKTRINLYITKLGFPIGIQLRGITRNGVELKGSKLRASKNNYTLYTVRTIIGGMIVVFVLSLNWKYRVLSFVTDTVRTRSTL